jgi:hypothetical protein
MAIITSVSNGTWLHVETRIGAQPIANTQTTLAHPLGTIVRAKDVGTTAYGEGEFIYLQGVTSTVVGLLVVYNATTFQTTILPNTANLGQSVAVAMSANATKTSYGWYQIGGMAVTLKSAAAISPQVIVYISATAGRVFSTSTSGKEIVNARGASLSSVTSTCSSIVLQINRPFAQGKIT